MVLRPALLARALEPGLVPVISPPAFTSAIIRTSTFTLALFCTSMKAALGLQEWLMNRVVKPHSSASMYTYLFLRDLPFKSIVYPVLCLSLCPGTPSI
ncbi:hypothetical protein F443_17618 [Phytophthora nicotianae P1569]|uniref:Uncharacterized protein n=2 Tax=Phytophthora nicotianae TaxID=4792 RepID=V9EAR8_PHYNI|nr:hypothetical protein F443_17618 [Phytophthora nicotianae P1569]